MAAGSTETLLRLGNDTSLNKQLPELPKHALRGIRVSGLLD